MKRKELVKNFIGAFIGVLVYNFLFDIPDLFQNYWANYFTEIILIALFAFIGILVVGFFINKFSLFQIKEKD